MAFTFNGLSGTAVEISGGASTYPETATPFFEKLTMAADLNWQTLHSTTAGKKCVVLGWTADVAAATALRLSMDGGTHEDMFSRFVGGVTSVLSTTGNPLAISRAAADVISVQASVANTHIVYIWGYEI